MQTTRLKKKGFTLVELVVVIAVIAVLSAILIPSIGCIVEQAKETNDTATVRLLNAALVEDEANNGKPELFRDAIKVVAESGYNIEKLTPLSSGEILWDSVNNRFLLKNKEGNDIYRDNSTTAVDDVYLWKIVKVGESISGTYSNYLSAGYTLADGVGALEATTGVDVGENQNIGITYSGKETAQDVVFYTNGGTVKFSDTNDESHQKHYGSSDTAEIATGNNCYEGHALVGKMTITQGKAVAGSGAYIGIVTAKASEGNSIALQEDGGVFVISASANVAEIDADVVSPLGYTKSGEGEEATFEASTERAEKSVYQITDEESLIAYREASGKGARVNAKLMNDITLTKEWTPFAAGSRDTFKDTFDGNNKTIYNLVINKNTYYTGFFAQIRNATVKNLNLANAKVVSTQLYVGGLVGCAYSNCTIENCTIDAASSITGLDNVGGLIGTFAVHNADNSSNIVLKNLINNATVEGTLDGKGSDNGSGHVGGIVGRITTDSKPLTATITDCVNNGKIESNNGKASGIVGTVQEGTVTLTNCLNNADLSNFAGAFKADLIGSLSINVKDKKIAINNCGTFGKTSIGCVFKGVAYTITVDSSEITVDATSATVRNVDFSTLYQAQ